MLGRVEGRPAKIGKELRSESKAAHNLSQYDLDMAEHERREELLYRSFELVDDMAGSISKTAMKPEPKAGKIEIRDQNNKAIDYIRLSNNQSALLPDAHSSNLILVDDDLL